MNPAPSKYSYISDLIFEGTSNNSKTRDCFVVPARQMPFGTSRNDLFRGYRDYKMHNNFMMIHLSIGIEEGAG
jgi:hypothetical protein